MNRGQRGYGDRRDFEKRLKRLKKDYQKNVGPSIKRHRFALSKSEREREKHLRALRKMRTRKKKFEELRRRLRKA